MNSHSNISSLRLTDPYQTGEAVQQLQQQLVQLDIPITVDGVFGPGTDQAIKTFQKRQELTPDGIVGPATRAKLQALLQAASPKPKSVSQSQSKSTAPANLDSQSPNSNASAEEPPNTDKACVPEDAPALVLKSGAVGLEVLEIQKKLKQENLLDGEADGEFGGKTENALKQFQKRFNLTPDGIAGPRVFQMLGVQFNRLRREAATQIFTVQLVGQIFSDAPLENVRTYLPKVLAALEKLEIGDRDMVLMALATIRAETARFEPIDEGISRFNTDLPDGAPFALYDFREDLGNGAEGDGAKYKGRGFIQLTGKENYGEYGKRVGVGDQLLKEPEQANDPTIAADVLAQFLKQQEGRIRVALHQGDFARARRVVNGGEHGLDGFAATFKKGRDLVV